MPISPLVSTPRPHRNEPLLAYLLRLSESNGHASPGGFLRHAEVSEEDLRTIQIPLEPVAALIGCRVQDIAHLAYVREGSPRHGKHIVLNGHPISTLYVNLRTAGICVECVREYGYVSAYWHLRHALACPRHGRRGLRLCPHCGSNLSWFRRGLLRCRCGYHFDHAPMSPKVDTRIAEMLEIVRCCVVREPLNEHPALLKARYPVKELKHLSLAGLLGLIERLGRLARDLRWEPPFDNLGDEHDLRALAVTATALRAWPHGFETVLEALSQAEAGCRMPYFGLRARHESFWSRLFKDGVSHEYDFLKPVFLNWGLRSRRGGIVHPRLQAECPESQRRYNLSEIADLAGIQPKTARKLIDQGVIEATVYRHGSSVRYACDAAQLSVRRPAFGVTYSPREAARILRIPVSVLRALQGLRLFRFACLCDKPGQVHEIDERAARITSVFVGAAARKVPFG